MAIRADSFSSVDEVRGFTRHLLDGHSTFDAGTRPTITEIEKFIDRASALINVSIAAAGFAPSAIYGNAVTKLACDDWVTQQAVKYVHYAQRNTGIFSDKDETFTMGNAQEFVAMLALGFANLGISQNNSMGEAIIFTGMLEQSQRADPDDSTKEQPLFSRHSWDNV
jgi:hypothetical protein